MPDDDHQDAIQQAQQYWDDRARAARDDAARVEQSTRAQRMRYEAFLLQHDPRGKHILDVGCGVGALWGHLQGRGIDCTYTGVDISPEMVARARENHPGTAFHVADLLTWQPPVAPDLVVTFGVYNTKLPGVGDFMRRMVARQFELARHAAYTSILTDRYGPGFAPHIQAWRAEDMLTYALSLTPYVALGHHYLPNDFSLSLYHAPLIDTQAGLWLD